MMNNIVANNNQEATTMSNTTTANITNQEGQAMMNSATANNNVQEVNAMATGKTKIQATNTNMALATVVTGNTDIASYLIDEDERAIVSESTGKIQDLLMKLDCSSILGMGNIRNILDNRLYAQIYENQKGFRQVEFCQKYYGGGVSPKMCIPQDDLMTLAMYEFSNQPINVPSTGVKRKISRFKAEMHKEYLGKFRGSISDMIPVESVLRGLATVLPMLPVYYDDDRRLSRMEFYNQVAEKAKNCPSQIVSDFNSYYALTEEEIISIAGEFGKTKFSFLRDLKNYGLLYLTDSSNGYQVNVRCKYSDGERTEWRYCIIKLSHLAGVKDVLDKESFPDNF